MNETQYMPFRFSDNETKKAYNVSVYDFLKHKNRYEFMPMLNDKKEQIVFNGHRLYQLYKDGKLLETRYISDDFDPDEDSFFSAVEFLTEHEEYTSQAAIMEVYLCIFGFPRDYLKRYGDKVGPESQFLSLEDLTFMSNEQISDLRPRSVSIKDWESSTLDRKLSFVELNASDEEKDIISNRYNKKISVSLKSQNYDKFVAPNPAKYCKHIEDFLVNTLNVTPRLVEWLIQKHLLYEDYGGNLVAPGYDENGHIRFAYRRSCWNKSESRNIIDRLVENSNPRYTWRYINSKTDGLYLFEDLLDAICYMDLMEIYNRAYGDGRLNEMKLHSFMYVGHLADASISDWIIEAIQSYTTTKKIYICFQNDVDREQNYGQVSAEQLRKFIVSKGYHVENIVPDSAHSFTEFLTIYKKNGKGFLPS